MCAQLLPACKSYSWCFLQQCRSLQYRCSDIRQQASHAREKRAKFVGSVHATREESKTRQHINESTDSDELRSIHISTHDKEGHKELSTHLEASPHRLSDTKHSKHASSDIVSSLTENHGSLRSQHSSPVQFPATELFPTQHVKQLSPQLLLYFPFGCVVAAVRMALWIILLAVDSPFLTDNRFMIQVLYKVLGIQVRWHGTDKLPAERHVLVSNHVTVGDLMILYSRPEPYVHLITSRLPKRITEAQNHRVKLRHASGDTYRSLTDSSAHPESIHLFPEGGMTNGEGMMTFSRGFMRFGRGLPIVPAAMRAHSDFGISTHTLSSSFVANMFWFCFSPTMSLDVTVLPPMSPTDGEGNGKFVQRVQMAIASELDVPIVEMTLSQKHMLH